jgi:citrate lyase subunit beta/citryl-CoA lyase
MRYAACALVMAANAAGVKVYACPGSVGEFRDLAAWRIALEAGRRIGSQGSLCIHPAQVGPANAVFSTTAQELDWARRVCAAWDETQGRGAVAVDGKMVDLPVARRARDMMARQHV